MVLALALRDTRQLLAQAGLGNKRRFQHIFYFNNEVEHKVVKEFIEHNVG